LTVALPVFSPVGQKGVWQVWLCFSLVWLCFSLAWLCFSPVLPVHHLFWHHPHVSLPLFATGSHEPLSSLPVFQSAL
jgi:hypothetical protein